MKIVFIQTTSLETVRKFPWVKKVILPALGILFSIFIGAMLIYDIQKREMRFELGNGPENNFSIIEAENSPGRSSYLANIRLPAAKDISITKKVPILMYHYIEPMPLFATKVRKGLTVTPQEFLAQMKWLKDNGYETITLSRLYGSFFEDLPLPPKPVILTFDDGYDDFFTYAAPIMVNLGQTADIFVITGSVGSFGYMDWEEIKKLSDLGFEIESHTVTHGDLTKMFGNKLEADLVISKTAIEKNIGKPVNFLCYPSGRYNQSVSLGAQAVGYAGAVTTNPEVEILSNALYEIPRVRISGGMKIEDFASQIEKALR